MQEWRCCLLRGRDALTAHHNATHDKVLPGAAALLLEVGMKTVYPLLLPCPQR